MESLENRIYTLERDMTEVKVSQGQIFELAKQANDIHARLSTTLDKLDNAFVSMEKSMMTMQFEIRKNTESIDKINDELECQKIENKKSDTQKLQEKIEAVDNKGKIDVVIWLKDNFKEILVGAALLVYYLKTLGLF